MMLYICLEVNLSKFNSLPSSSDWKAVEFFNYVLLTFFICNKTIPITRLTQAIKDSLATLNIGIKSTSSICSKNPEIKKKSAIKQNKYPNDPVVFANFITSLSIQYLTITTTF